jgi:ribokinase
MARVVVLGSSNTDMTVRLPHLPAPGQTVLGGAFRAGPGGKGANQAVAAKRAGAEVVFLTAVGDDDLGRQALVRYRREGIDVTHATVIPGVASGVALIFVGDDGENMIGVAPGANDRLGPEEIDRLPASVFAAGGVLLASLEVPLATVTRAVQRGRRAGMTIMLNPAPMNTELRKHGILELIDILTPNLGEAAALAGRLIESADRALSAAWALHEQFAGHIIMTLGAEGCLIISNEGQAHRLSAFPVEAVDTVGAGDAFSVAFAVALAEGRPLVAAARWATAAAALAVTSAGAQEGMPHRGEIERMDAESAPVEEITSRNQSCPACDASDSAP